MRRTRRSTYSTLHGFQVKNSWWDLVKIVRTRARGMCEAHGCRNKGNEVHHVNRLSSSRGVANDPSNCIFLCKECHDRRHTHLARIRR